MFIRHRTSDEIDEANAVDVKSLRDPEADSDRAKRPEWLIMLGVWLVDSHLYPGNLTDLQYALGLCAYWRSW